MNRSDLINALKNKASLSRKDAERVFDVFFDEIKSALINSDRVEIRSFGSFNSAGECYLHTVEVAGSNPVPPTSQ